MSGPAAAPNQGFHNRLNRVAEVRAPIEAAKPEVPVLPDWKAHFRQPIALLAAVLAGAMAVAVTRYLRFYMTGGTLMGDDADTAMLIDAAMGATGAFLLVTMFQINGAYLKIAQILGAVAMVVGMHNAVHAAPWAFNLAFSTEWTRNVVTTTEPNSILFRGTSYVVYTPREATAEPVVPVVRRAGKA
ncbi:MAG: hypothetical protein QNJ20_16280 [Paracoccaceae bacterium]|nr:hypothetical protein [Paracoccaceae bacterium]